MGPKYESTNYDLCVPFLLLLPMSLTTYFYKKLILKHKTKKPQQNAEVFSFLSGWSRYKVRDELLVPNNKSPLTEGFYFKICRDGPAAKCGTNSWSQITKAL